eukprot:9503413-Lingulodinium_polyedra.AAC.1
MPRTLFRDAMSQKYDLRWAVFGPQHLGRPERRERLWFTAICKETLVWVGPETIEATQDLFR